MLPLPDFLPLRPGGAPWLMRHELRLFVAESAAAIARALQRAPNRHALPAPILGWIVTVYLVRHVAAWGALPTLPYWRPAASTAQLHLDGAAAAVLFILMLSAAMVRCVHVIYRRDDLDLLLCAPVPAVTILRARLGGVVLGTLLLTLFLIGPVVHVGVLSGRPRLLALYPGLVALATIAASMAMMLAVQLARWIGPRYTAILAQVPGTVLIVGLYFLPKLQHSLPAGIQAALAGLLDHGALLGPASPLWLPVRALQGDPVPLLLLCLAALALAQAATALLQHGFLRLLQQGRNQPHRTRDRRIGFGLRFGSGIGQLVLSKEWLLILRQPLAWSQLTSRLIWPAVALAAAGTGSLRPLAIAAIVVFASAALAGTLTRLVETGEQAWDLLASAPVAPGAIAAAKRNAALLPALVLGMPVALWLGIADARLGVLTAVAMAGACVSANRLNRIDRQGCRAPTAPLMTPLPEVLSNGLWVVLLLIAFAIVE
jgi:ABC-2 type transport system permease protein